MEKTGYAPEAIDLSHHLSSVAKRRVQSPLKGLQKYYGKPGVLSLAGGLPHPSYFPFDEVKANALVSNTFSADASSSQPKGSLSWIWNLFSGSKDNIMPISIPKYPETPDDVNLAVALQYGLAKGIPQLQKIIQEFSTKVYRPAYANFATIIHAGNTDAWNKSVMTLCNPGEGILTSEWTYPSAIASMKPFGISPVPVKMDSQGMSSIGLRQVLSSWDEIARGMPRPHVMYIVPVGQNPTGATMLAQRKKEIYDICVEYDVIIVEDDPYYFLQEGPYVHPAQRPFNANGEVPTDEKYIMSLAPSFLAFDYQGRVVRLDTFSKTIAPGSRLGWFTCHPIFAEKFERQAETSSQAPCGFGQTLITELLINWQFEGYLRWLKGLGAQYTQRRNFFLGCIFNKFHVELASASHNTRFPGSEVYLLSKKTPTSWYHNEKSVRKTLVSFVPPSSGMFVWMSLHFDSHPKFKKFGQESLEMQFWTALADAGLLVGPGTMFSARQLEAPDSAPGHLRISFSNAEFADLKKSVDIFATVLEEFHKN
ncbi:pyridoxal phosphate-dependent transferase [Pholiota molesta]|nr:pyridoxal phosphate-dependent transferase [Pholiota molesta]